MVSGSVPLDSVSVWNSNEEPDVLCDVALSKANMRDRTQCCCRTGSPYRSVVLGRPRRTATQRPAHTQGFSLSSCRSITRRDEQGHGAERPRIGHQPCLRELRPRSGAGAGDVSRALLVWRRVMGLEPRNPERPDHGTVVRLLKPRLQTEPVCACGRPDSFLRPSLQLLTAAGTPQLLPGKLGKLW